MLAEGLGLSGIVSILFTGVVSVHRHFLFSLIISSYYICLVLLDCLVGYEALYVLEFIRKFAAICFGIFSFDIITG